MPDFRIIPSIEQLRQRERVRALLERYGHAAVVQALRDETDDLRQRLARSRAAPAAPATTAGIGRRGGRAHRSRARAAAARGCSSRPCARSSTPPASSSTRTSGGRRCRPRRSTRSPRSAGGYSTLEYDLEAGGRGHRDTHAEALLCRLTGAEAAVVVNNCAAATMLDAGRAGRGPRSHRVARRTRGDRRRVPRARRDGAVRRRSCAKSARRTARARPTTRRPSRTAPRSSCACTARTSASKASPRRRAAEELVAVGPRRGVPVVEDLGSGNLVGGVVGDGARGSRAGRGARPRGLPARRADGAGQPRAPASTCCA